MAMDLTQQALIFTVAGTEGGTTIPITAGAEGGMASAVGPDTEGVLYTAEDSAVGGGFQVGRGLIAAGHLISAYRATGVTMLGAIPQIKIVDVYHEVFSLAMQA
jgi:hypothetical protein